MKRLKDLEITARQWIISVTIFSILLMAISLFTDEIRNPMREMVSVIVIPMQKGINTIGTYSYSRVQLVSDIKKLQAENKELHEKIANLTEENSQLHQNKIELQRLRELYDLGDKYSSYQKTAAHVIAKEAGNWYSSFTIDKGSNQGIKKNMNVIADGGLVGIITEVGANYSIVSSIIDDNINVSAMLINSGDTCTVEGSLNLMDEGHISVKYLKSSVEVKDGDKVVTSNISSKFMEGILVGYIKDVTLDSNNLTKSGYLIPVVDFEHLQEVLVILELKEVE